MADEHDDLMDQRPNDVAAQQVAPELVAKRLATKNQRDSIVQRLERWIGFMATPQFAEEDLLAVQTRIERGTNLWKLMEDMQLDHIAIADPADVIIFGNEFMELEERYFNAHSRLKRRSKELGTIGPMEQNEPAVGAGAVLDTSKIRLVLAPQQSNILNTWGYFDGTLLKWKQFMERYTAAIHNNDDVSAAYKFSYLLNSLKGKAADSLKGYNPNKDNYDAAWNKLYKDYNRSYPLAREYLHQFFQLKAISEIATAEELRRITNVTNETIMNLKSLDYPVEHWSMIIVHVLHGLLNNKLAYDWNLELRNVLDDNPTTENMVEFLEKHASAATSTSEPRQNLSIVAPAAQANRSDSRNHGSASSQKSSRASSQASAHGPNQTPTKGFGQGSSHGTDIKWDHPCGACNKNHMIYYCPVFKPASLKERLRIVKNKELCMLCLRTGHPLERCFDKTQCSSSTCVANGTTKHNSMVCPVKNADSMAAPAYSRSTISDRLHRSRSKERRPKRND